MDECVEASSQEHGPPAPPERTVSIVSLPHGPAAGPKPGTRAPSPGNPTRTVPSFHLFSDS